MSRQGEVEVQRVDGGKNNSAYFNMRVLSHHWHDLDGTDCEAGRTSHAG